MEQYNFYHSKLLMIVLLAISGIFISLVYWALDKPVVFGGLAFDEILGLIITAVFFGGSFLFSLYKLLKLTPDLRIDSIGIHLNFHPFLKKTIPWQAVSGVGQGTLTQLDPTNKQRYGQMSQDHGGPLSFTDEAIMKHDERIMVNVSQEKYYRKTSGFFSKLFLKIMSLRDAGNFYLIDPRTFATGEIDLRDLIEEMWKKNQ